MVISNGNSRPKHWRIVGIEKSCLNGIGKPQGILPEPLISVGLLMTWISAVLRDLTV